MNGWNSSSGKENRFECANSSANGCSEVTRSHVNGAMPTWTQSPVKGGGGGGEPFRVKQQQNIATSLAFCDAERELGTADAKEPCVAPKTPSKQAVGGLSGKSPLKSGGKGAQAWQFLLSSVGRLSPKLSPVDKKPNLFSSTKKSLFASPLKESGCQNFISKAPFESTPNLTNFDEDLDHAKRTRRTLFTPEIGNSTSGAFPEESGKQKRSPVETGVCKTSDTNPSMTQKTPSKLSRICDKTNNLFRVVSSLNSPQKPKNAEKNRKFDKMVLENCSFRDHKTGQPSVDVLYEFSRRGMEPLLLKYLDDYDLFCCSLVCKSWNSILKDEIISRKQIVEAERQSFLSLNSTQEDMENFSPFLPYSHVSKFNISDQQVSANCSFSAATNRSPFCNFSPVITNVDRMRPALFSAHTPVPNLDQKRELKLSKSQYIVCETNTTPNTEFSPCSDARMSQSTSLLDLRSSREDKLVKCPSCMSRAKVTPMREEGVCSNEMCRYRFCSRCDSPYHGSSRCLSGLANSVLSIEEITSPTKLQAMATETNCSSTELSESNHKMRGTISNTSLVSNNSCVSSSTKTKVLQGSNSSLCSKRSRNSLRRL